MFEIFNRLLALLYAISRFRSGPQDMPDVPVVMWLFLFGYTCANMALLAIGTDHFDKVGVGNALLISLLDAGLLVLMTWSLLRVVGHSNRMTQTLSALAGISMIFAFLMLMPFSALNADAQLQDASTVFWVVIFLVLSLWHFAVYGHILRHSLDTHLSIGLSVALVFQLLSSSITQIFFPALT